MRLEFAELIFAFAAEVAGIVPFQSDAASFHFQLLEVTLLRLGVDFQLEQT